jgi:CAAX prenyl protease-like protein
MWQPANGASPDPSRAKPAPRGRDALLRRHRWLVFVLPLAVYMLAGSLEPTPQQPDGAAVGLDRIGLAIPYACYPLIYTVKIALSLAAVAFVLPGYREFPLRVGGWHWRLGGWHWRLASAGSCTGKMPVPPDREFPPRVGLPAITVGAVGIVVWVGLCSLSIEQQWLLPLLQPIGLDWLIAAGARSGFNPLAELAQRPAWAWGFLAIRFFGLVAVGPLVEEFFYRGFLMRFVVQRDWWEVPPGQANTTAVVLATLVPMAVHPAELLAAAAWFSMVTWLFLKTRNIWDCVAAHAVTNLLLGIYVVASGQWQLM